MRIALFIILYSALSTISVFGQAARVYTSGAHFDEGELLDVNHNYVHDQLQLSKHGTTIFPIIWIANADEGTVSKLDTQTGRELGRYYTGPPEPAERYIIHRVTEYEDREIGHVWHRKRGQMKMNRHKDTNTKRIYYTSGPLHTALTKERLEQIPGWKDRDKYDEIIIRHVRPVTKEVKKKYYITPYPSATAMDFEGNVWVANRGYGTVIKILNEGGFDSNENERIDTSKNISKNKKSDENKNSKKNDGVSHANILPWWQDERVVFNIEVGEENSEPTTIAVDADNNVWVGLYNENRYVKINGETGEKLAYVDVPGSPVCTVIDGNGFLWSANGGITKIFTRTGMVIGHLDIEAYSIAVDNADRLWVADTKGELVLQVDTNSGHVVSEYYNQEIQTNRHETLKPYDAVAGEENISEDNTNRGITPDTEGNIWVTNLNSNSVTMFNRENGEVLSMIPVGDHPVGIAVDSKKNMWAVNRYSGSVTKIDATTKEVEGTYSVGAGPCGEGDITGFKLLSITTRTGLWALTHDSGESCTSWRNLSWNCDEPDGTQISVRVRSSEPDDVSDDIPWVSAENGVDLKGISDGQLLHIETKFISAKQNVTPILFDLTVTHRVDYLRKECQDMYLLPADKQSKNNAICLKRWNFPKKAPVNRYIMSNIRWEAVREDPKTEIKIGIFGSWRPQEPICVLYEGPLSKGIKPFEKEFSFRVPKKPGNYRIRLIASTGPEFCNNFYGREKKEIDIPQIVGWSEMRFSARNHD